jgi:sugar phosphate isomerase/epimerase
MFDPTTRRTFLKTAGLGVAASTMPVHAAANQADGRASVTDVDTRKGVELAIATICLDGFGDENFEPAFRLIPQIGLTHVEFNVWHPRTVSARGIGSIQERCFRTGLTPVCLQGNAFGGHAAKDVTHKLWLMEQAKRLGCRRIKCTGARRGTEGGLETVITVLKELAPAAEEMDVLVLVENHANNTIENIDDYDQIFAAVDSSHVGMCLDMGHFDGASVSNIDVITRFPSKVWHIDLKDTVAIGTYKTVNYGSGATDLHGIVRKALEHEFTGYLIIEQAPPLNPDTLVADLTRARDMFAQYIR